MITCPICNSTDLYHFLEQKNIPAHQNMIFHSPEEARNIARGDLDMAACENCTFVFNAAFDDSKTSYDQNYDNSQCYSSVFESHLDEMAQKIITQHPSKDGVIVEVGCGKGDFLKALIDMPHSDFQGYGFDPTYVGPEEQRDGKIQFEKRFYDRTCAAIEADIVVCRHVIEHVKDPKVLLHAVAQGLENSTNAKVFFETPDVSWIFKHQVIWDFFYEHCSLFTPHSITRAFVESGFDMHNVGTVFGEQYLWAEAQPGSSRSLEMQSDVGDFLNSIRAYQGAYMRQKDALCDSLAALKAKGPVALWGAGAKGVTLANMVDPDSILIDSIIDINPNKQNGYVAGTGHKIIGIDDITKRGIRSIMIMNPNYRSEIERDLKDKHIEVDLINSEIST